MDMHTVKNIVWIILLLVHFGFILLEGYIYIYMGLWFSRLWPGSKLLLQSFVAERLISLV
jgi:hypothetical protein